MWRKVTGTLLVFGLFTLGQAKMPIPRQAGKLSVIKTHITKVPVSPASTKSTEDTLRFDDPATAGNNAIGLTQGGTYIGAIRLTPEELAAHSGDTLVAIVFLHYEQGSHSGRAIVWGQGSANTPGDTLTVEQYSVTGQMWYRIDLTDPQIIAGDQDIWVGIEITHQQGEYPLAVDAGPAEVGKGDWVYLNSWDELSNLGLNYNWDILAIVHSALRSHDVGVVSINAPSGIYLIGDTINPAASVRNFGQNQETFYAYMVFYDENGQTVYRDSVNITLDPGQVQDVTFASYPVTVEGNFHVVTFTLLTGDENPANDTLTTDFTVYESLMDYLVIDLDPTPLSGPRVDSILASQGLSGTYTTDPTAFNNLSLYRSVWVFCGIYDNNASITPTQGANLETYLQSGGRLYLEGGDIWGWDASHGGWNALPYTGVANADDGSNDLSNVAGLDNGLIPEITSSQTWSYTGENNWIDQLTPGATMGGNAEAIFMNPDVGYNCGVAYNQGTWKTVSVSFELAGLNGNVPVDSLVIWIAKFLDVITDVQENSERWHGTLYLKGINPVRNTGIINFGVSRTQNVEIELYNAAGRKVVTLFNGSVTPGVHTLKFKAKELRLASGVYIVRLKAETGTLTNRIIVIR